MLSIADYISLVVSSEIGMRYNKRMNLHDILPALHLHTILFLLSDLIVSTCDYSMAVYSLIQLYMVLYENE